MAYPRTRTLVEVEIQAARWEFLAADEAGDPIAADEALTRMDELLDEYAHIPHQRPATP